MNQIKFTSLVISRRKITLQACYNKSVDLWFKFDRDIEVTSTQVALAMATLCGRVYDYIEFEFEVDSRAVATISECTGAEVSAHVSEQQRPIATADGNALSFSGGFDSLAAWKLMPERTQLVSLDFGGWFEREAEFFRKFDTIVISTNVRSVPSRTTCLTRNHWSFMAIGAILAAGYLNVKYHTFGQIFGESMAAAPESSLRTPLLAEVGYEDAGYARGLTEAGTASIIIQSEPRLVLDSLKSLAGPRDRKLYRKTALTALMAKRLNIEFLSPQVDYENFPKVSFGDDYATSLAALLLISKGSGALIEDLLFSIPDEARDLARNLTFDFVTKVNWDAYHDFPESLKRGLRLSLERYGFETYSENDWNEVKATREMLIKYHHAVHS
ncbi:hypothetical protein [Brevibacterium casei]|uniref:hypothetical protein n=1 Tax=Brevibacterium casei TaxID=33889 RepID=UPI0037010F7B